MEPLGFLLGSIELARAAVERDGVGGTERAELIIQHLILSAAKDLVHQLR
jgi:hypothetical protein